MSALNIDWHNIDTVLLDMDGTLLDLHFDNFFWLEHLPKRYSQHCELDETQVRAELQQRMTARQGTLNWYCTDFWSDDLNIDIVCLKREILHLVNERPQVVDFLKALGEMGKERVLVTNAHRDSVDIKFSVTAIEPLLDQVISSHDYGCPKEDQKFWRALQLNMPFDPARTLFIDDSEPVLLSAEKYGIAHLLCIAQPDSQQPNKVVKRFSAIEAFDQIVNLGIQA
jgi:putative hydrolase of the HAD superfamily